MKTQLQYVLWITTCLLLALLIVMPALAQDAAENPLLRLLRFVPDTPENRQYLIYGDAAAWHESWDIPRVDNLEQLDGLERDPRARAYWMNIMPRQTTPPDTFGVQYLLVDDMRSVYGFDLFNVDRFVQAGQPPNLISAIEYEFPRTQIADALLASGYTSEPLDDNLTLYSILSDYEIDGSMETVKTSTGQLGGLNRIGLLDGQVVIAKATKIVTDALAARNGQIPSLADDPNYVAGITALSDAALGDKGELVGAIIMDGAQFADIGYYLPATLSPEAITQFRESLAQQAALPSYNLVIFATRHSEGATHLILAVVFPQDTDAKAAANALAERLQHYTSLVTNQTLADRWTFEQAAGTKVNAWPVALVSMRVDDPLPTPDGEQLSNTGLLSWSQVVFVRDTGFLAVE